MAIAYRGKDIAKIICRECGEATEVKAANAIFCGTNCANSYDRRRARRAVKLYDVFMEMRFNRKAAKGMWTLLCRLAEEWRDEDKRIRKGLQSWKDPRAITEERVDLIGKRGRI